MRLPRRIFLNVVIFVSSFLVVSYHLSSIVPQDGTVHNVLYRYLFRTIFLFRPRAPAAPCSRSFLLSYCSTPPLKRKIKFSLQTVPFVPTPAAFFFGGGRGCYPAHIFCRSGAAGVGIRGTVFYRLYCYRRHSLPGSLFYTGCYPAHNSGEPALESPAQFTAGGVVIGSTISVRCASRGKKMVVIGRTIRTFFCGRQVVIHSTICAVGKNRLLLSAAHFGISSAFQTCPDRVVIQRTFPAVGLLSGAQFPNCRILAAVVIDGTFLKKSTVQRTAGIVIHGTIRFFRGRAVVIRRTIRKNPVFFGASCRGLLVCAQFALQGRGCYRRHNTRIFQHGLLFSAHFPAAGFFHPPCWSAAHISHFSFFRARGLLYSTLFKNPTKFSLPPFSCKKTFLPLLRSAHCCVFHICVGRLRTAPL